jgi:hypothetical protein
MAYASTIIPERHRGTGEGNDPNEIVPGMLLVAILCLSVILFRFAVVAATPLELNQGLQATLIILGMIPAARTIFYCMPGRYRPRMASLYFTVALGPWSALAFGDLGHLISYLSGIFRSGMTFWLGETRSLASIGCLSSPGPMSTRSSRR